MQTADYLRRLAAKAASPSRGRETLSLTNIQSKGTPAPEPTTALFFPQKPAHHVDMAGSVMYNVQRTMYKVKVRAPVGAKDYMFHLA